MTAAAPSPVPVPDQVRIHPGPALLAGLGDGPSLDAHRARHGATPEIGRDTLLGLVTRVGLRGRGGAAFPFATKLQAAARGRRPVVVVNLSEGEPASAKDMALALARPHLVLDGAIATARSLGTRDVHLVLPADRSEAQDGMRRAVLERDDDVRLRVHIADARFVAGQARAVVELMAGRPNLPVTAWAPEAVHGHRGRPTLLSNAETWAQLGHLLHVGEAGYRRLGTPVEPGTTLLTISRTGAVPTVFEAPFGTPLRDVLPSSAPGQAALVGGFHGVWANADTLAGARISVPGMASLGLPLGAGVIHLPTGCPLAFTSAVVGYLADQSAQRCGPCLNGLPALADAVSGIVRGQDAAERVDHLSKLLARRGACAHPDGTVRMVRSMFIALPDEIAAHRRGICLAEPVREVVA